MRGKLEAADLENLRPDVAVQAHQSEVIGDEYPSNRGHRRAVGQRQPELLVFVGGGDELVGVGLDADGDADQHILDDTGLTGDGIKALDLGHRVDHDMTDAGLDRRGQLGDRFVVAVQRNPLRGEVGVQRDRQLAAGADVQREAFLVDPPRYFAAQEGLGGVVHVRTTAECRCDLAAPRPEIRFVDDEKWRAVLLRQPVQRDTGDTDDSVVAADRVVRPDVRCQLQKFVCRRGSRWNAGVMELFGVPWAGRVGVHIRSGARTPRMANPLAMTWRVAWHSARRAVCSWLGSSSPCGNTRHES